jgi:hypothetical protein
MPGWVASVALTALLSMASACVFLLARCRGVGRAFGPTSKWWAFSVIVITCVVATYIGLAVPSGLWLGKVAKQRERRRRRWLPEAEVLASWLTFTVRRMDDRMGDDLDVWCEARVRSACSSPRLLRDATVYYHDRIVRRWPKDDRRRQALDREKDSILHKVEVVRLINLDTTQQRIDTALRAHPATSPLVGRFTREDLANRLLDSGENELRVMLSDAYRQGRSDLLIYGLVA